ncbi:hypothetical protein CRG98_019876 [Punica granatum]|uniref:Uncharacterized protein n=1 Tax=Punica granatum TaxID=22663 RepID=A0A2I0JUY4_PUNGR|nr:hypothetical protein CRG98_019876 [Punica granatum]
MDHFLEEKLQILFRCCCPPNRLDDLSTGILMTGSTEIFDGGLELDGPGRSSFSGALAEMRMLQVMRATERVTSMMEFL